MHAADHNTSPHYLGFWPSLCDCTSLADWQYINQHQLTSINLHQPSKHHNVPQNKPLPRKTLIRLQCKDFNAKLFWYATMLHVCLYVYI